MKSSMYRGALPPDFSSEVTDGGRLPILLWPGCPQEARCRLSFCGSAGKRLSSRTMNGNRHLRVAMVQAAHSGARTKTHLGARYRSLRPRLGSQKTAVAVARSILVSVYAVLEQRTPFHDLGVNYRQPDPVHLAHAHLRQLERLGFRVTIEASPAA